MITQCNIPQMKTTLVLIHNQPKKLFIKPEYLFQIDSTNKKFDNIIATAVKNTKACLSYFNNFNHFALTILFLTPKERELHCSHEVMLRTKITHTYTYYKSIQHHYTSNTPTRNPHHIFTFINSKYTSPYFLNFMYCIENTTLHGFLRNYGHIRQMFMFSTH